MARLVVQQGCETVPVVQQGTLAEFIKQPRVRQGLGGQTSKKCLQFSLNAA
jgi:hypothetical protein